MAVKLKTFLLAFLILSIYSFSGIVEGLNHGNPVYSFHKDGVLLHKRKLLGLEAVLDYDDAGANTKHDPRKGKPGGGKNP